MPNWCNNRLQIVGKGTDVLAFVNDGIRTALAGRTSFEEKDEKINYFRSTRQWKGFTMQMDYKGL